MCIRDRAHVEPLNTQLVTLQTQCIQQPINTKQVFLLEKRVEDWMLNIMLNLKHLIEMEFNKLNDSSKDHCHRLNVMRLSSKGIFCLFYFVRSSNEKKNSPIYIFPTIP